MSQLKKMETSLMMFALIGVVVSVLMFVLLPRDLYSDMAFHSPIVYVRFFISAVWMAIFAAFLSHLPRVVAIPFAMLFFFPAALVLYLAFVFGLRLEYGLVADFVETNPAEMASFLSTSSVLCVLAYVAIVSAGVWSLKKLRTDIPHRALVTVVLGAVLLGTSASSHMHFGVSPLSHVCFVVGNVWLYCMNDARILKELERLDATANVGECKPVGETAPIVMLHIGESFRADHASFNGYHRETMPNVRREFDAGNVLSFKKCVSFAMQTRVCVLGIMTPSKVLDPVIHSGSFIPYLNAHGISTFGFFSSMHRGGDYYDSALERITRTLNDRMFTHHYCDALHGAVSERIAGLNGAAFLLYYGEGAHIPGTVYDHSKHSVFKPDAWQFTEGERRINAYDNCMIATDAFIGNALDALKDKNALYMYVADHGDMLGEDGYWVRNSECYRRAETRHVLAFIWASKRFQTENAGMWMRLKANHAKLGVISHDVWYHTVLSAFNIRNSFYEAGNDLFSSEAKPFPTEMPAAESFGVLRFKDFEQEWDKRGIDKKLENDFLKRRASRE